MGGKNCRLYDENLVHNIMVSTGLSILDFLKENQGATTDDICEFVEVNAPTIIEDTIEHLNSMEDSAENIGDEKDEPDSWSLPGEEEP